MIRQALLGPAAGRAALRLRDAYDLLTAGREAVGAVANDQLAAYLTPRLVGAEAAFIDVGAHIGSVIAAVRRHRPGAHVIAFEAIPEKAARLSTKFPGVRIEACALSDHEGRASFFIDLERSGYSSLARGDGRQREIEVPLRTLDVVLGDAPADIIKVDVEGAELGVLRGGEKLLASARPTIMFESAPHDVLGYSKEAMWRFLTDRGYAVFVPNRVAHGAPGLSLDGFIDSHHYPRRTTNYFAVAVERRDEIRASAREILKLG